MVERIKKLCSDNKTSIKALEKDLGFGNGTIRRWNVNAPSFDRIALVANRFNVPISFITGDEEQKEKPTLPKESELSPVKQQIWDLLNSMDDNTLDKALIILRTIAGG